MNTAGIAAALRQLADALEADVPTQGTVAADLTVGEAAAVFRRSPSAVRGWLERGALRGYKLNGKSWRVPAAAVAEFRAQQERVA